MLAPSGPGTAERPGPDPGLAHAICRFRLTDGPVRIVAALEAEFWSAAIFDRRGANLYSLNDRTAGRAPLDLLLIGAADLESLQLREAAILDDAVVVDLPTPDGVVLIRVFLSDPTMRPQAEAMLAAAACATFGDDPVRPEAVLEPEAGVPVPAIR